MNIFSKLFGIFRQRGLVATLKEGHSITGFAVTATIFSIIGGLLYGFSMGIGLGIDTAIKDSIKVGMIIALVLILSLPIFWVAYRLLGREERFGQIAVIPITLISTVAIILAVTAPIVFMLSVLQGFSSEAVYIHIIIIDLAVLIGLYLGGTLVYHSFSDHRRLIIPNVVGFLLMGVILVVLMSFFGPFLAPYSSFSVGTDRLKDGLGIGVAEKANQSLVAAASADRSNYRFQTTNENGDLMQDYSVTRVGNDYFIEVHLHAVPGETFRDEQRIWVLDEKTYTDFEDGVVTQIDPTELDSIFNLALPPEVFTLPTEFADANWRAIERGGLYTVTGTSQSLATATLVLDARTGRLSDLVIGSAESGLHAEVRALDLIPAGLDRAALEASLNQAIVVGSVDRSDASMQDYVQDDVFFVVRYPRNWHDGTWSSSQQRLSFTTSCFAKRDCPALTVSVFDLVEEKGPRQYAEDLGRSLGLQPAYREITTRTINMGDQIVGEVEYLFDRVVSGKIETVQHIEYIFEGELNRYHLDFSTAAANFETFRESFREMANLFTYLGEFAVR